MKKIFFLILFVSNFSVAARLEDVKILEIAPSHDNFKLTLQLKNGPKNSYFFVDVIKADGKSFEKLGHVVKKLMQKDNYKLDLDIPSFSPSPSGSYYRSDDILFFGSEKK